jgi:hypothetical protein
MCFMLKPNHREGRVSGTVRLYGPDKLELRGKVFQRSNGFCEAKLKGCQGYTPWLHGHLAHIKSRGAGGADTEENTLWACGSCHLLSHQKGIKLKAVSE